MKRHVAILVLAACGKLPSPKDPSEHALFRDLERQVTVAATTGWGVDRLEIEAMLDPALDSVCRVDVMSRRSLRDWLDSEIARLGGPIEEAWRARGKDLSEVSDLLVMHRVRMLLARAEELSLDCPFWLEPEMPFRGRQIAENRWQIIVAGGGKASAFREGTESDVSAGGAGRLLFGRTFYGGDGIYIGAELGAGAQFKKDETGARTALQLGADFVTPLVYRYMITNAYVEFEGGWLAHATEQDWTAITHGIHFGFAVGARALRQRIVFPGAAIGISYERVFQPDADLTMIKVGARVTFELDL